jgi:hypothetical protein
VERSRRPKTPQPAIVPVDRATVPAIRSLDGNDARDTFKATGEVSWRAPSIADAAKIVRSIPRTKIRPAQIAAGENSNQELAKCSELVLQTLFVAARSGDEYHSQERKRRASAKQRATLVPRIKKLIDQLRKAEGTTERLIPEQAEALPTQPLRAEMKTTVGALRTERTRFERILEECLKSAPGIEGRPCDAWMLGYIGGMARGWQLLTTLPITPRGYFPRFLEGGLKLLLPDKETLQWDSLIKTATKRFCLKGEKPLQPSEGPAPTRVEKLTPDCE